MDQRRFKPDAPSSKGPQKSARNSVVPVQGAFDLEQVSRHLQKLLEA
jgi:hypothetical protein